RHRHCSVFVVRSFFFFNSTATTEIYTLSLHDALPIYPKYGYYQTVQMDNQGREQVYSRFQGFIFGGAPRGESKSLSFSIRNVLEDRKSTRLNSSHVKISYAVFCLKKKKKKNKNKTAIR